VNYYCTNVQFLLLLFPFCNLRVVYWLRFVIWYIYSLLPRTLVMTRKTRLIFIVYRKYCV
jgi:hypothetical protein